MKIFPDYSKKERAEETKVSFGVLLLFIFIFVTSCGIFVWGGSDFPPTGDGVWSKVRWALLVVSVFAFFLTLQALLEFFVAATIGPERFWLPAFSSLLLVDWLLGCSSSRAKNHRLLNATATP